MLHHYSTANVSDAMSIESWRQAMAEVYYRLDINCMDGDRLNGEIIDVQFDSLGISNFKADAQRVIRRKESAKFDYAENFVFLFPTRKDLQFQQRGCTGLAMPGSVLILNSAEDYIVDVPDGSENITIKIDRMMLIDRVKGIDALVAKTNIANLFLVPVVAALGAQLLKMPPGEGVERLQASVVDLICLMLDLRDAPQNKSLARQTLGSSMFCRFQSYMRQHLCDIELSPEKAARDHNISVRYLHKIFHYHGTSFGKSLLEFRLQRAFQLIANHLPGHPINIGEVAFECGFLNQSHFSTCYRRRFGVTPRESGRNKDHARRA